jgi:hypothetical protein
MATREQVDELLQKMGEERDALLKAALSLTPEQSLFVPADAEGELQWTAREQLSHLWEMERAYDAWVEAAIVEVNPDITNIRPPAVPIPIEEANDHAVEEIVAGLREEREKTISLINRMSLEEFDFTATSPVFGTLTNLQWLRSFYRHDRQHRAQMLGEKSDYKPNFKGGKEPNQRQMRIDGIRTLTQ